MRQIAAAEALARAAGDSLAAAALANEYSRLRNSMGGDDPAHWATSSGAVASTPLSSAAPLMAPPTCSGSIGTANFVGATGFIQDVATQEFTCNVAGVGARLWSVDLNVVIDHTFASDLDFWLIAPSGKTVVVSTDNGGSSPVAFGGTRFSDSVLSDLATDFAYSATVPAANLAPEGRFTAFRGENPAGTWKLRIADDLAGDDGFLLAWSLDISTVAALPAVQATTVTKFPNVAIADNTTFTSPQTVSGAGSLLVGLSVRVDVTQTYSSDLDIRLQSPAGTEVWLTTDNGGGADDVFRGTLFTDLVTDAVSDHVYSNLVTATPLSPEGALANFYGQDPNGIWRLKVRDDLLGDTGVLERWDLTVYTCSSCDSTVTSYCTSSTTTNGCHPSMSASGTTASIGSGPGSFMLSCSGVEGQKSGLIFYSISGRNASPWSPNSTSILCVKPPTQRMRTANAGGTTGACDGALHEDFFDYLVNFNPPAMGNPPTIGSLYQAQTWFRDPPAPKTTNLSDALEFALCP